MARAVGMKLSIDGLDELLSGSKRGGDLLNETMRDILRGPVGNDILRELKARTGDYKRTGYTLKQMRVADDGRDGVAVGIPANDTKQHPHSPRANAKSIGVWLESGTRPHLIPTKVSKFTRLRVGGRVVSRVTHPGTRGHGIMKKTLKAYRGDVERVLVRELERRLGRKMNMIGGV